MTTIGNKIKKVRELRNYTQEYMANKLGMSLTGYGNIERDETDLQYSRLEKIADALGMRIEDLISFDEKIVFNFTNNTNHNAGYIVQHVVSDDVKKLYEGQIQLLTENITLLKEKVSILEKLNSDK